MRIVPALFLLGTAVAAHTGSFSTFGSGCPGPTTPSLTSTYPGIGTTAQVSCSDLPLDTVLSVLFLGSQPIVVPLDLLLNAPGWTAYVGGVFSSLGMSVAAPTATAAVALPNHAAIIGITLAVQALGLSIGSGWVASDRGSMGVGDATIVLRDSITSDPAFTQDNGFYTISPASNGQRAGVAVPSLTTNALQLQEVSVVLSNAGPFLIHWGVDESYNFYIWPDIAARNADPDCQQPGCQLLSMLNASSNTTWGITPIGPVVRPTRRVVFDLPPYGISIPAGSEPWIGFDVTENAPGATAVISESDETGPSDAFRNTSAWILTSQSSQTIEHGRYGVKITATVH